MKWLKRSAQIAAIACALLAFAGGASAQLPSPGYTFVEVTNENGKPVSGATAVVYDESGKEVRSSVTNSEGRSPLIMNGDQQQSLILRVIKRGYLTYESVFRATGGRYANSEIKIKLASAPERRRKAAGKRSVVSTFKGAPPKAGRAPPPSNGRPGCYLKTSIVVKVWQCFL